MMSFKKFVLPAAIVAAIGTNALATPNEYLWIGGYSNSFTDWQNWAFNSTSAQTGSGTYPGQSAADDQVTVAPGITYNPTFTLAANKTFGPVTINSGAQLTIAGSSVYTMTVDSIYLAASTSKLILNHAGMTLATTSSSSIYGEVDVNADATISGDEFALMHSTQAKFVLANSSQLNIAASASVSGKGLVQGSAGVVVINDGEVRATTGPIDFDANVQLNSSSDGTFVADGATAVLAFHRSTSSNLHSNFVMANGGTMVLDTNVAILTDGTFDTGETPPCDLVSTSGEGYFRWILDTDPVQCPEGD